MAFSSLGLTIGDDGTGKFIVPSYLDICLALRSGHKTITGRDIDDTFLTMLANVLHLSLNAAADAATMKRSAST